MAESSSPRSMDIDVVVDLHTNATVAAAAAQALLNDNSSNASSNAGLSLKFPVLYTSSSDTETDDYQIQRNRLPIVVGGDGATTTGDATTSANVNVVRSTSPPPNCAICLGRCKNKCFTDSCVHQFCFKCLCEWSKVKAECPLCKQAFRSIIHNVKAIDQYEEYLVQQPVVQIPHSPLEVTYQGSLNSDIILNGTRRYYNFSMRSWPSQSAHHSVARGGPITVRNFMSDDDLAGNSIPPAAVAVENQPMRRADLLNLYRQELPDEISSTMSLGQLWRRYIYDRKLYALPVADVNGRYRESSARFYRHNPGQRVRLIPFANRDIVCLLRNTNHDVSTVLESLNEGLEMCNILSRSFRRRLQPFLGERTAHFIHELSNFARSPYDMIGYDRVVQYAPQAADEDHIIEFSTSSEEETNNNNSGQSENTNPATSMNLTTNDGSIIRRPARRNAQPTSTTSRTRNTGTSEFRLQSRNSAPASLHSPMSLLSFTITTTSEGSETPGLSVAVSAGSRGHAQVAAINLSTHNRVHNEVVIDLDDTVDLNGASSGEAAASATNTNANTNAVTNSNTANEIANLNLIGNSERPSSLPLNSPIPESSPQIVASIALTTSSSDECEFVLERKPPHLRTPEMVSLNSESDSDVVFVEETKNIMAEATYNTSENEDLACLVAEQQDVQLPSTSKGLRQRAVRQSVATKRQSSSSQRQENGSKKKRRICTRHINAPTQYTTDGSTSDENDIENDSEYNGKQRSRGRTSKRKRVSRTRKENSSRRCQKRRRNTVHPKNEMLSTHDEDQDFNATNEPRKKMRRISSKSRTKGFKFVRNSTIAKRSSTYSEESSTEEDDKMNLKALQLRLKKYLNDEEENTSLYSPSASYKKFSYAFDVKNTDNTNNKNNNNTYDDGNHDADDALSMPSEPSCSKAALRQVGGSSVDQNLNAETVPPTSPRPTTSAAAAVAAAAAADVAIASLRTYTKDERRASFEESNASNVTSCFASTSETPQEKREETETHYDLVTCLSPASQSPASIESYVPQSFAKQQAISLAFESNSSSSLGSNSSIDSYQLPNTSQKPVHHYLPSKITEPPIDADLNESGSSNSSTTSSSSSSSPCNGSEEECDSDEHPLI